METTTLRLPAFAFRKAIESAACAVSTDSNRPPALTNVYLQGYDNLLETFATDGYMLIKSTQPQTSGEFRVGLPWTYLKQWLQLLPNMNEIELSGLTNDWGNANEVSLVLIGDDLRLQVSALSSEYKPPKASAVVEMSDKYQYATASVERDLLTRVLRRAVAASNFSNYGTCALWVGEGRLRGWLSADNTIRFDLPAIGNGDMAVCVNPKLMLKLLAAMPSNVIELAIALDGKNKSSGKPISVTGVGPWSSARGLLMPMQPSISVTREMFVIHGGGT